jgi:tetratricopeptide (TPR) repeat protein
VRQLSNALLFDIAPKIERVQGSTAAREALVNQSLKYLDSLAGESGDDASLQSELASAYEKVGDLQGMPNKPNLSDFAGAIASYEKAQTIRRRLAEKQPADTEARRLLAKNLRELQNIRLWQTDAKGSQRDLQEATAIYESLLTENPQSLELRADFLDVQLEQALNLYENAQFALAIPLFQNIVPALEELNRRAPDNTGLSTLLVRAYKGLSLSLSWESRQAEGEAIMARALPLAESLVAANPGDVNLRHSLYDTYTQASSLNEGINDKLSFEFMQKALRIVEETIKMDEANIQARHNLALTYSRMGAVSTNLKQPAEALAYLEKALAIFTDLEAKEPRNLSYKRESAKLHYTLGAAHRANGNLPDALKNFEKAAEFFQTLAANQSANTEVSKRDLALATKYTADIHSDLAQAANGENQRTHRRTAKENYQRALDIFLQLEASNTLAEFDRKYLEEIQAAMRKYESD